MGGAVANDPEHPAGQRRGGLVVITVVTSSLNCLIPVVGEMVPSTFAGVRDCAEGNGGEATARVAGHGGPSDVRCC